MEQQSQQGQKTVILFLASSILIAGILISGAIISRSGNQEVQGPSIKNTTQGSGQTPGIGRQIPSCGV